MPRKAEILLADGVPDEDCRQDEQLPGLRQAETHRFTFQLLGGAPSQFRCLPSSVYRRCFRATVSVVNPSGGCTFKYLSLTLVLLQESTRINECISPSGRQWPLQLMDRFGMRREVNPKGCMVNDGGTYQNLSTNNAWQKDWWDDQGIMAR